MFSDADSDYFTFGVTTSDSAVATVSWSDGTLTVTGVSMGNATITMTASDNYGGSATDSFNVTVTGGGNSPPPDNNDPNDPPYDPPVLIGSILQGAVLPGSGGAPDFDGQTLEVKHVTDDSTACLDVQYGSASNGQDVADLGLQRNGRAEVDVREAYRRRLQGRLPAGEQARQLLPGQPRRLLDQRPHGHMDVRRRRPLGGGEPVGDRRSVRRRLHADVHEGQRERRGW